MITRVPLVLCIAWLVSFSHAQEPHPWVAADLYKKGQEEYRKENYPSALDLLKEFRNKNLTVFLNPPQTVKATVINIDKSILFCEVEIARKNRRLRLGDGFNGGTISGMDVGARASAVRER